MAVKVSVFISLAFLATAVITSPVNDVDEQKPFDCPHNEQYYKCHLEVCFKRCDHLIHPPPCPSIASGCYLPACVCSGGYLRLGDDGPCVPEDKCPKI